jgi:hypothetical protein
MASRQGPWRAKCEIPCSAGYETKFFLVQPRSGWFWVGRVRSRRSASERAAPANPRAQGHPKQRPEITLCPLRSASATPSFARGRRGLRNVTLRSRRASAFARLRRDERRDALRSSACRSASIPACGFTGLSCPVFPGSLHRNMELATRKSPLPADRNVDATSVPGEPGAFPEPPPPCPGRFWGRSRILSHTLQCGSSMPKGMIDRIRDSAFSLLGRTQWFGCSVKPDPPVTIRKISCSGQ